MEEENSVNKLLIEKTLEFHGLPLIKTWNEENGANSLKNLDIQSNEIDTTLYYARLKNLSYTDRTKRMKLHHFICSKSAIFFRNYKEDPADKRIKKLIAAGDDALPPLEFFSNINRDQRTNKFFSTLKAGDIAYGIVLQATKFAVVVKVLCTVGSCSSLVPDLNIRGVIAAQNLIPAQDPDGVSRSFIEQDYVCCEVVSVGEQHPLINLGMLSEHERYENGPSLGLISFHQMPHFYKIAIDPRSQDKSYNKLLRDSDSFDNPAAVENLLIEAGLQQTSYHSLMSKSKFPQDEYAKDLRQQQASKLAFRSVAEGIAHFKEGRHTEAFQCLNKALSIDARNVEGLVARGALFANSGTFQKAIVDFESALKINPNHGNAKKYLGETLLALGRSYEEDNKFEEAQKAYIDCLNINPHHKEALASLNYIKTKINARKIVEPAELELPPLNIGSIPSLKESKRDYHESSSKSKDDSRSKKSKKDKKKKGKKRHSSSSDSTSDSSDSSDSSSESSDNSSSSSESDSNSRSKKKDKKRKSMSPISKRIDAGDSSYHYKQNFELDDHELKVKKFLEMGKDEDDYEDKVGQLIAEASKYQRSKQAEEAKQAKKKKKSEKKMKKEKKKRKKEDKKKSKGNDIEDLKEALKMFENLPEKIKKLYQEKMREEEAAKQSGGGGSDEGKWKMKFSKDERQGDAKKQTKNFSLYESDEEEQARNFQSHAPAQSGFGVASTSASSAYVDKKRSPSKQDVPPAPIIPKGPVVLDKFGNFRLAEVPQTIQKPADTSSKRSRSRSRRSRSRSDSRSPRRRRSSSYRRRHSRSRSRSYSRSHSRSPSRSRGGRGYGRFDRSRQRYSPRGGGGGRGGGSMRGRWNDNFNRDNRDFRRNDRFDRDRQRGGINNRGGGRFVRYDRRSYSRSPHRSPARSSPERKDRWADEPMMDDMSRKDDKELVKKTNSGSSLW